MFFVVVFLCHGRLVQSFRSNWAAEQINVELSTRFFRTATSSYRQIFQETMDRWTLFELSTTRKNTVITF